MGRAFTDRQQADIQRVIDQAGAESGLRFSVYVGRGADDLTFARRAHTAMGREASRTVLIVVDPHARVVEIVTGDHARRFVDDRVCGIAAMSMATSFAVGDLAGGIRSGVSMLAEHARRPPVLDERAPD